MVRVRHRAAVLLGAGLEIYDFLTFSYFSPQIGAAFFPGRDNISSLLAALGVFAVGFVARPLGSVVFGRIGDRVGRRAAMQGSFILMGVGLGILVLTPPYAQIGLAAPILVVIGRIIQGVALGGEVGPSTAYLVEASPPLSRGLSLAWLGVSQNMASLLAGAAGAIAATLLAPADMALFGWRIVMGIGLLILPIGYVLRRYLPETLLPPEPGKSRVSPDSDNEEGGYRPSWKILAIGFVSTASGTVTTYLLLYLPTYASVFLKTKPSTTLTALAIGSVVSIVVGLLTGALSDRVGRLLPLRLGKLLFVLTAVPATLFMNAHPDRLGIFASAVILSFLATMGAGYTVWLVESLPMARRSFGAGVVMTLAITLLGGATQPALTWAMAVWRDPLIFGYVLAGAALVGLIASLFMHETAPAVLARRGGERS